MLPVNRLPIIPAACCYCDLISRLFNDHLLIASTNCIPLIPLQHDVFLYLLCYFGWWSEGGVDCWHRWIVRSLSIVKKPQGKFFMGFNHLISPGSFILSITKSGTTSCIIAM